MRERKRILLLALIMFLVAAGVGATAILLSYRTAFDQERFYLLKTVKAQARLLEAVASFDSEHASYYKRNAVEATLSQVEMAFKEYTSGGSSAEYVLGRSRGVAIEILLRTGSYREGERISIRSDAIGEPMRWALQGRSGSGIARDYRGVEVLAAYEPVGVLNMGVVAKIDLAEIRIPFIRAAGWVGGIALVLISVGSLLFLRISRPLLVELQQSGEALQTLMESTVGLTGQAYFDRVVSELCRWLGADGANIGRLESGDRVRSIVTLLNGRKVEGVDYALAGTPCENVVGKGPCVYPREVCGLFPDDRELRDLRAQGYAGVPVRDHLGEVLGIIWVISRMPLHMPAHGLAVLEIIAARTGAEMLRMRAEAALRENMEKFRALVETTEDFVWEVDGDCVYSYCSPQAESILGYQPRELVGRTPFDLMEPGESQRIAALWRKIIEKQASFTTLENTNLHRNGREVVLETSGVPFFDAAGRLAGYRGIARDITRRRQAEAYLRENEERFRELIEALPNVAVQGYDRQRRVIYWNNASTLLYGYPAEEAIGARLEELIIPQPMRPLVIEAVRAWMEEGRQISAGELELVRKDGTSVAVYSSHVMLKQGTDAPEMFCIDVDLTEQKRARADLERLATYDQLTRLPNRNLLGAELNRRLKEAERFRHKLAVFFIDLDDFKTVNDSLGHEYGDMLLQQVARRVSSVLREYDILARFGGDEFVLLMPRIRESAEAAATAEKIIRGFGQPFDLQGHEVFVSASIGISVYPDDGSDSGGLLKFSDAAMYRAKHAGRNGYQFFTRALNDTLSRRQRIASRLRTALSGGELALHYQPQVALESGEVRGCEALLRWMPADGEPVSPAEFIPVAEKSDLIARIGEWVIDEACRCRAGWKRGGLAGLHVDVNLSGRQLLFRDFFPLLDRALEHHGLTPEDIGIELTENVLIQADAAILSGLERLRGAGMRIAVDDFGTGYSSLSYLKRFPVTALKIDQAFVRDAPTDAGDRSIMQAIVAMGHSLGLEVVVEGIETQEQLELARKMGCDLAQGFLFYRPTAAGELEKLLRQRV